MIEEAAIEAKTMESDYPDFVPIAELSDAEAHAVIHAVEPIVKRCKRKAVIRPKPINLFKDQPLNVKLENGVILSLNFAIPEN